MAKRLLRSCFLALVICGVSFYLAYFIGLMYATVAGPVHPANDPGLQSGLRHIALPLSLILSLITFWLTFRRAGPHLAPPRKPVEKQ